MKTFLLRSTIFQFDKVREKNINFCASQTSHSVEDKHFAEQLMTICSEKKLIKISHFETTHNYIECKSVRFANENDQTSTNLSHRKGGKWHEK